MWIWDKKHVGHQFALLQSKHDAIRKVSEAKLVEVKKYIAKFTCDLESISKIKKNNNKTITQMAQKMNQKINQYVNPSNPR